jgi:hypothetical protein
MSRNAGLKVPEACGIDRYELGAVPTACRQLPETGFVRLRQIIGDPRAAPPIPPVIPVDKSTW